MDKQLIYIISTDLMNQVKIGISNKPEKRLKQLQTGFPGVLRIVKIFEIDNNKTKLIESMIHQNLKFNKIKGEWFNISVEQAIKEVEFALIRYDNDGFNEYHKKAKIC